MAKKALIGKFITFEGPEGCGKSTQSKLLYNFLKSKGHKVLYTREPGGTDISEAIRDTVLNPKFKNMSDRCELLLFIASRAQIVDEVITPAIKKGATVILDRYEDATLAYQGYGAGIDLKFIKQISDFATGGLKPDLTILLDISTKAGLKRAGCKDRLEHKKVAYHEKVRSGYLKLAKQEPRRIKVIKVDRGIDEIQSIVRNIVLNKLNIRTEP